MTDKTKAGTPRKRPARPGEGQPEFVFDMEQVERLAGIGCTDAEIAAVCGCSRETIKRHKKKYPEFCALIEKGQSKGAASLRHLQFQQAKAGNTTMLIWLGKQYLDQRDKSSQATGQDPNLKPAIDIAAVKAKIEALGK